MSKLWKGVILVVCGTIAWGLFLFGVAPAMSVFLYQMFPPQIQYKYQLNERKE